MAVQHRSDEHARREDTVVVVVGDDVVLAADSRAPEQLREDVLAGQHPLAAPIFRGVLVRTELLEREVDSTGDVPDTVVLPFVSDVDHVYSIAVLVEPRGRNDGVTHWYVFGCRSLERV